LLIVDDVLVGKSGLVLLPAIERAGLQLEAGDVVDLVAGEAREEVEVLAIEADRNPSRVRLRIAPTVLAVPRAEVWPSQSESRVVMKRRALPGADARRALGVRPAR
jgi:hypothetical protein